MLTNKEQALNKKNLLRTPYSVVLGPPYSCLILLLFKIRKIPNVIRGIRVGLYNGTLYRLSSEIIDQLLSIISGCPIYFICIYFCIKVATA